MRRDLRFLAGMCLDDFVSGDREELTKPMRVEFNGEPWAVATDGYGLVAVTQDNDFAPPKAKKDAVVKLLTDLHTAPFESIDLAALRAWLTPDSSKCAECKGTGLAACACPACGHGHEAPCDFCHPDPFHGWFYGRRVNRALVSRALAFVADEEPIEFGLVQWPETGPYAPIAFRGAGWLVGVMPMRFTKGDEAKESHYPAATVAA